MSGLLDPKLPATTQDAANADRLALIEQRLAALAAGSAAPRYRAAVFDFHDQNTGDADYTCTFETPLEDPDGLGNFIVIVQIRASSGAAWLNQVVSKTAEQVVVNVHTDAEPTTDFAIEILAFPLSP
jgi:hypothetical protein